MFDLFDFDLPGAVTEQLEKRLQSMQSSTLTERALQDLAQFQEQHKLWQGVYQLLLKDEIVYTVVPEAAKPDTFPSFSEGIEPAVAKRDLGVLHERTPVSLLWQPLG
jgi:hypothetical protein